MVFNKNAVEKSSLSSLNFKKRLESNVKIENVYNTHLSTIFFYFCDCVNSGVGQFD